MTKSGEPSVIQDIRYYGETVFQSRPAEAFGHRLAMYLNALGFCLGPFTHLNIVPGERLGESEIRLGPTDLAIRNFGGCAGSSLAFHPG